MHEAQQPGTAIGSLSAERPPGQTATPMYQVVMLNDDYTPMEFVVVVMPLFFAMSA